MNSVLIIFATWAGLLWILPGTGLAEADNAKF
jgi:hypothetical protein